MVAQAPDVSVSEVFPDQVEVGFALPVDQVARVDDVVYVPLCPVQGVPQGFFLVPAEGLGAADVEFLLLVVLFGVGGREVRVGQVQDGEGPLQADLDDRITQ